MMYVFGWLLIIGAIGVRLRMKASSLREYRLAILRFLGFVLKR